MRVDITFDLRYENTMQKLTSDCIKGINLYTGNQKLQIISKAYVSGKYHDNYFYGSFCPPTSGMYRLIYEGSVRQDYENKYSSYKFKGNVTKNRISEYYHLYRRTCYSYTMIHSFDGGTLTRNLYYQKISGEKQIVTSSTSFTCTRDICFMGSRDPQCRAFRTYELSTQRNNLIIIILIFVVRS